MPNRPPPCGTKGLVAPQDIASGLVTGRSVMYIAQTRAGQWNFWTDWTPEQRANAEVRPRVDGQPIGPGDLALQEVWIARYIVGAVDTFPACPVQEEPPSQGRTGLLLLLGAILVAVLAMRQRG